MSGSNRPGLSRRVLLGATAAAGAGVVLPAGAAAAAPEGHGRPLGQADVDAAAARLEAELIALRRRFHADPEVAGEEEGTAAAVAERLRAAGLEVHTGIGGHGVVAVLRGDRPGRTVAYRADMDAVPQGGYADGDGPASHACGHDVHTTVGVGVALVLAGLRRRLRGTVVFLFQPGEEKLQGARAMIAAGALTKYGTVEEIHALHCGPFPVGRIAVTPGVGLPGQDNGSITVTGPDAAAAAGRLAAGISALNTVPFPTDDEARERMVRDVQTPDGPLARFVVTRAQVLPRPDTEGRSVVRFTYRCWPEERYTEVREGIRRLVRAEPGAELTFQGDPFPAMVCPEREADAAARHLRRTLGRDSVTTLHAAFPYNGEDFALFLDEIPGTYSFLGVRAPGAGIREAFPHYLAFAPDERAIGVGVRAMAGWLAARARD
ncbi:M20 metallopeptidase family protein [Kitasatospora sp. NPDC004240]